MNTADTKKPATPAGVDALMAVRLLRLATSSHETHGTQPRQHQGVGFRFGHCRDHIQFRHIELFAPGVGDIRREREAGTGQVEVIGGGLLPR